MIRFTLPTLRQRRHLESGAFSLFGVQTKSKGSASSTSWDHSFALYCFSDRLYPASSFFICTVAAFRTTSGAARYLGIPLFGCQWTRRIIFPLTLYSTLFSRLDEKNIKLFLRKDSRHSLSFDNRIRKTSFTKSFFGQRKSRKRKPDRLIPVGALGKWFATQRKYKHPLCCSFSVSLYILSLV